MGPGDSNVTAMCPVNRNGTVIGPHWSRELQWVLETTMGQGTAMCPGDRNFSTIQWFLGTTMGPRDRNGCQVQ